MRTHIVKTVCGLAALALYLSLPISVLAGDAEKQPTQKSSWNASLTWLQSCCPPDIFKCRPEPKYCQPDCVCPPCVCRPEPQYCQPDCVCPSCLCNPQPWNCKPECVCCDPEPRCREECPVHCGSKCPSPDPVRQSKSRVPAKTPQK
jgi:hypothetical protein